MTEQIQIYTIIEAKTVNELVKLVNIKTKQGWLCIGGMGYAPNNFCEADSQSYPFCQSMYRMEKPKKQLTETKKFEPFPYDGKQNLKETLPAPPHTNFEIKKTIITQTKKFKKKNYKGKRKSGPVARPKTEGN